MFSVLNQSRLYDCISFSTENYHSALCFITGDVYGPITVSCTAIFVLKREAAFIDFYLQNKLPAYISALSTIRANEKCISLVLCTILTCRTW